ncbi:MAG: UMP kinase [Alphaproteobacteria bacterium]|jgi:uridylate kinase|nr:UMP kinase [Alphaproteobacteria bacterium]
MVTPPSSSSKKPLYNRVLLKISGQALAGEESTSQGINQGMLEKMASEIAHVHQLGVQVCVVVGGGNIYRGVTGAKEHGIDRATSDYMGMMATIINALALQNALEQSNMHCRVMCAFPIEAIGETYIRRRALRHMEKGRVVIFAGGTGNPFFTTDTAAALRASEMGCDLLLKATKVDGVYSSDPHKNSEAEFHPTLSYDDILNRNLGIMDATAVALSRENLIPIAIFSIFEKGGFAKVVCGKGNYTLISEK